MMIAGFLFQFVVRLLHDSQYISAELLHLFMSLTCIKMYSATENWYVTGYARS